MAIYLYYCPYCEHSFEISKPMSDSGDDEECPRCGIRAMRKYTPVPFSFGWRLTDRSKYVKGAPHTEIEPDI